MAFDFFSIAGWVPSGEDG